MTEPAPGDLELVSRCRSGDLAAFDHLVRRHRERALAAARCQTADDSEAEDIVQEAFVEAFRSLPGLRDCAKFAPWFRVILQRVAARQRRDTAGGEVGRLSVCLAGERFISFLSTPQEDEIAAEVGQRVHETLAELTQQNRHLLELFYVEGMRCREIAARLAIPLGTVKRRLHDSRKRFRKEWRKMTMRVRTEAARQQFGRLETWVWGQGENEAFPLMSSLLAQSIALAINKRAKSIEQIADEVGASAPYIEDLLGRFVMLDLATKRRTGRYLLNFVALDREDHNQLRAHAKSVGRAMAERLEPKIPEVRTAYERTEVAKGGWDWEGAQWIVIPIFVCNAGIRLYLPEIFQHQPPLQPDGKRYWFMGSEAGTFQTASWVTGCNMFVCPDGGNAHFWTPQVEKGSTQPLKQESLQLVWALVGGPKTLPAIVAESPPRPGREPQETVRTELSRLVESGCVRRSGSRFELVFPVYQRGDFDVLMPAVEAVVQGPTRDIFLPGALAFDGMLEQFGYGHLKDQFAAMRGSLAVDISGWALTHLHEMGAVPDPPETAPASWGFFGWLGENPFWPGRGRLEPDTVGLPGRIE
jgi:RNA polymerase sigma-70 factor (ECF subfamily)